MIKIEPRHENSPYFQIHNSASGCGLYTKGELNEIAALVKGEEFKYSPKVSEAVSVLYSMKQFVSMDRYKKLPTFTEALESYIDDALDLLKG